MVYHFLKEHFTVSKVLMEDPVPRGEFLKKRARKLGWVEVGGQVLFQLMVAKPMARSAKKRIMEIKNHYRLSSEAIPAGDIIEVGSVNSAICAEQLQILQPDLVIVHGTRIISKKILNGSNAIFINIHAGITPRYRGSHGAYWALANGDNAHCGVTVHLVDAGIDTGNILAQARIPLTPADNFVTYPYLQLAEGLHLMKNAIDEMEKGKRPSVSNSLDSALWHHPTLWGYLWKRITKGVK